MSLRASYDAEGDVLYVSLGAPRPCYTRESDDGLLIRTDMHTGKAQGVTVIGVRMWDDQDALAACVAAFLNVDFASVSALLPDVEPREDAEARGDP